ncbi:MAG: hypothetical protein QG604_931 [Candidatus Dependentiae bacterium]|nr:hypothetical protein [Candidatus Dependentiae bacterium]
MKDDMAKRPRINSDHELRSLCNVGPATLGDLLSLGITSIAQLATCDPEQLFRELEQVSGHQQNICMLDLFHAIVHEAQAGERRSWSYYSKLRRSKEIL